MFSHNALNSSVDQTTPELNVEAICPTAGAWTQLVMQWDKDLNQNKYTTEQLGNNQDGAMAKTKPRPKPNLRSLLQVIAAKDKSQNYQIMMRRT